MAIPRTAAITSATEVSASMASSPVSLVGKRATSSEELGISWIIAT